MTGESVSRSERPKQKPDRYRDGILWGLASLLFLLFFNPHTAAPAALVLAAVAGYRGKSIRPAIGTILTVLIIAGAVYIVFSISISGINR